ncbi:MAG: hypothetical protein QXE46_01905 [Candidatus Thermoplasmatota archaeon]
MKIIALFIAGLFILCAFAGAKKEKFEEGEKTFSWFISPVPYGSIEIDKGNEASIRYSFYFLTAHYRWEKGFHADGIIFHFPNIYDGREHWANLTGYAEIKFLDGEYYRNDNYNITTHWWGSPGFTYYYIKIIFSKKIEFIHLYLDYTEDNEYIRTIDRTFYGNWNGKFI